MVILYFGMSLKDPLYCIDIPVNIVLDFFASLMRTSFSILAYFELSEP